MLSGLAISQASGFNPDKSLILSAFRQITHLPMRNLGLIGRAGANHEVFGAQICRRGRSCKFRDENPVRKAAFDICFQTEDAHHIKIILYISAMQRVVRNINTSRALTYFCVNVVHYIVAKTCVSGAVNTIDRQQ